MIKAPSTSQCWINSIRSICRTKHHHRSALIFFPRQLVQTRQQLCDNTPLHFTLGRLTLRRNGINLINK